jgi:hypothetical protein
VELVGNLARQGSLNAERAAPPPAPLPPKPDQSSRTRNDAGGQSRQLSANQNAPVARRATPRTTSPGGFNLTGNSRQRPTQASSQFLAQQIAQESAKFARVSTSFTSAAKAYDKSGATRTQASSEPVIITRSIDRSI